MIQLAPLGLAAMADMSHTPYAIAVLLLIGIIALCFLRPANSKSGIWLPVSAFLAGPIIAIGYFAADVFLVSGDYLTTDDYIQSLIPILIIGLIGGAIGSISFWIGDKLRFKPNADASKQD
ncbi:hypothetical protein [Gimesia chilikensis]|uniref:hypothetical protein n=1 Tax=Gimesia chilikensis TaxID=2605989 RepID=UPI003A921829